ncbi:hypothetical protein IGI04_013508 [Brassica rapa subsp. trilocularis]|uniref:Carboxypeptidase n=1 Tax=Brassica rapa subsp. trilocularis TaxID=1813537 RepID=A0ABQ7N911_BRACM|nr:hypothetical protein IGI04_013508 [Brassica rapa subsp. trilocularis]
MAKTRWSCFAIALLAIITRFCNCEEAVLSQKEQDRVSRLPGQDFDVDFAHYSGFVTTNEKLGRALFYWLFEAAEDAASKPLVLWLNGGPGCSSVGYGEAEEIGPFHIKSDGKTIYLNQYSWNQVANILFLDAPVGVGYSYSNTSSDLLTNGDQRTAKDSLKFLLKWVELYPEYKGREFYIAGESYAGHYIPQLSQAIVEHNQASGENTINLMGYMVGNGLMDDFHDSLGLYQYIWTLGFISDQTYSFLKLKCGLEPFVHTSEVCLKALDIMDMEIGDIDQYSVFTPACVANASQAKMLLKKRRVGGRVSEQYDPCTMKHSKVYFNLPEVQEALHVPPGLAPSKWDVCSDVVSGNWKDSPSSVLNIYHELIAAGLRIWVFSGDADAVVPVTSTRYSIDALKLHPVSPYGPWYIDGQVGGWTQEYDGLNFVTVRGAGHEVPLHRPKEALALFQAFISGTSLSTPENSISSEKGQEKKPKQQTSMVMVSNSSHHNKEINVRRRISAIYNKREEDFSALKDYNDYLEEVECMNGINVGAIEEKIKRYSQENAEQIMVNRARKAEDLTAALAACKSQPPQTDTDTSSNHGTAAATAYSQAPRPTGMGPQPVPIGGGGGADHQRYYSMEDEAMLRVKAERAIRAGGFSLEISKKRAFEEAFSCIWV